MGTKKRTAKATSEKSDFKREVTFKFLDKERIQEPLKMNEFIEWIALPKKYRNPKTQKQLADKIGVSQDTLTDWKKIVGFWKEVKIIRDEYFREQTSEVLSGLLDRAKEGRAPEVKLFLQYFEAFSETKEILEPESSLSTERQEQILKAISNWTHRDKSNCYVKHC